MISFLVMRDLGAARAPALVGALLFAFLPYHLLRNEAHLFLTSYYAIPLLVWLVVCVAEGRVLFDRSRPLRTAGFVAICVVGGAASNYYAVFGLLVLLALVPVAALARRSRPIALQGAAVVAVVGASFALCHAPAILYPLQHGSNDAVAKRAPAESELFGLKLAYMVLPRPQHRIELMARQGKIYFDSTPLRSEGFEPSLGSVASLGFAAAVIILLATGLAGRAVSVRRSRMAIAGAIAITSFVIGTVGGIATLIAYEVSPQVRAWNRLSLVIAFAALLTVVLLLTAVGDRLRARGRPPWIAAGLAVVIGVLGILDQTSTSDAPAYAAVAAAWTVDRDFGSAMQQRFPQATTVLQLPYMSYPENGSLNGLGDYDLFKGYLHTTGMRWTYGAVRGRPTDWLAQQGRSRPSRSRPQRRPPALTPCTSTTPATPTAEPPSPPRSMRSPGRRLADLGQRPAAVLRPAPRGGAAAHRTTPAERASLSEAVLYPVVLGFGRGFSYQENANGVPFRWAARDAELTLDDPLRGAHGALHRAAVRRRGDAVERHADPARRQPQAGDRHRSGSKSASGSPSSTASRRCACRPAVLPRPTRPTTSAICACGSSGRRSRTGR